MESILERALKHLRKGTRRYVEKRAEHIVSSIDNRFNDSINSHSMAAVKCIDLCAQYFKQVYDDLKTLQKNEEYENSSRFTESRYSMACDFSRYPATEMQQVFGEITDKETLSIMPYLLAAYYINSRKDLNPDNERNQQPQSMYNIFVAYPDLTNQNFNRDVITYTNRFTLKEHIPNFLKKKRSDWSKKVQDIHTVAQYVEFLNGVHLRKTADGQPRLEKLQYEAILFAFAYSLCVLACIHTNEIAEQVDYVLSFDLFEEHTKALDTNFLSWLSEEIGEYGSMTIKELICADWGAKQINSLATEGIMQIPGQLGITEDRIKQIPYSPATNEWAENSAYIIATYFHPCNYSGWSYPIIPQFQKDSWEYEDLEAFYNKCDVSQEYRFRYDETDGQMGE